MEVNFDDYPFITRLSGLPEPGNGLCITLCKLCMKLACNLLVTHNDLLKMIVLADPWKPKKQSTRCFFWRSAAAHLAATPPADRDLSVGRLTALQLAHDGRSQGRNQRHSDKCLDVTDIAALRCLPSDVYRNHAF